MESAIFDAFLNDSDDAFEELLALAGAAAFGLACGRM